MSKKMNLEETIVQAKERGCPQLASWLEELRQFRVSGIEPARVCALDDFVREHYPDDSEDAAFAGTEIRKATEKYRYFLYITGKLPMRVRLEQVAEEAAELSQAALKLIRAVEDINPTPVGMKAATEQLMEEYSDVDMAMAVFLEDAVVPPDSPKWERWAKRLGYKEED